MDVDHDTVTCRLCAADAPRAVAFGCEQDRRGTLWLRPYPHGRRTLAHLCPACASFCGRHRVSLILCAPRSPRGAWAPAMAGRRIRTLFTRLINRGAGSEKDRTAGVATDASGDAPLDEEALAQIDAAVAEARFLAALYEAGLRVLP